jgi:hypothetical protein
VVCNAPTLQGRTAAVSNFTCDKFLAYGTTIGFALSSSPFGHLSPEARSVAIRFEPNEGTVSITHRTAPIKTARACALGMRLPRRVVHRHVRLQDRDKPGADRRLPL